MNTLIIAAYKTVCKPITLKWRKNYMICNIFSIADLKNLESFVSDKKFISNHIGGTSLECDIWSRVEPETEFYTLMCVNQWPNDTLQCGIPYKKILRACWRRIEGLCEGGVSNSYFDYIDVGDGCWRRNVLVTSLSCWWQFWPFLDTNFRYLFILASGTNIQKMLQTSKVCHQYP